MNSVILADEKNKPLLYAFWKFEQPPYCLGGGINTIRDDGRVTVDGYGVMAFKPFLIVPYDAGLKIADKLEGIARDYGDEVAALHEKCQDAILKVIDIPNLKPWISN